MDAFLEILKYVLPSIITFGATYFVLNKFLENEQRKRLMELRMKSQHEMTPIRLQAYERLILFLERINPTSLIPRVHKSGMSARYLQSELMNAIRTEFEHNLTQQMYIGHDGWELVKNAKEEMIKLIHTASSRVDDSSSGVDLSKIIFDITTMVPKMPTQVAIDFLKGEIKQMF